MTSPSPAKHRTTGWRVNIPLERLLRFVEIGLWIGGFAVLVYIANTARNRSGKSLFESFGPFGQYVMVLTSAAGRRPLTTGTVAAIAIAGFILWLTMDDLQDQVKPATPKDILMMPPPPLEK